MYSLIYIGSQEEVFSDVKILLFCSTLFLTNRLNSITDTVYVRSSGSSVG